VVDFGAGNEIRTRDPNLGKVETPPENLVWRGITPYITTTNYQRLIVTTCTVHVHQAVYKFLHGLVINGYTVLSSTSFINVPCGDIKNTDYERMINSSTDKPHNSITYSFLIRENPRISPNNINVLPVYLREVFL